MPEATRFFRYKGTPTESAWLVIHTFQDRGTLGRRPPRPVDAALLPLVPSDRWSRGNAPESDQYDEVPASEVPAEVRQLAESRIPECPLWWPIDG